MTNSYTKKKKRKKRFSKNSCFNSFEKKWRSLFNATRDGLGWVTIPPLRKIRGREKRAGWNLAYWRAMKAKRATINIEPPREMHTPIRANEIPSHGERIRSFKNAGLTGSLFDLLLAESSVGKIHFRKRVIPLFASLLLPFLKKTQ